MDRTQPRIAVPGAVSWCRLEAPAKSGSDGFPTRLKRMDCRSPSSSRYWNSSCPGSSWQAWRIPACH